MRQDIFRLIALLACLFIYGSCVRRIPVGSGGGVAGGYAPGGGCQATLVSQGNSFESGDEVSFALSCPSAIASVRSMRLFSASFADTAVYAQRDFSEGELTSGALELSLPNNLAARQYVVKLFAPGAPDANSLLQSNAFSVTVPGTDPVVVSLVGSARSFVQGTSVNVSFSGAPGAGDQSLCLAETTSATHLQPCTLVPTPSNAGRSIAIGNTVTPGNYEIRLVSMSQILGRSQPFQVTAPPNPTNLLPPTGLTASNITSNSFVVSYTKGSPDAMVAIEYAPLYSSTFTIQGVIPGSSYQFALLQPNTAYRVRARGFSGQDAYSAYSQELQVTTLAGPLGSYPSPPQNFRVTFTSRYYVQVEWTNPEAYSEISVVKQVAGSGITWSGVRLLSPTETKHTVQGLQPNTTYNIKISAKSANVNLFAPDVVLSNVKTSP